MKVGDKVRVKSDKATRDWLDNEYLSGIAGDEGVIFKLLKEEDYELEVDFGPDRWCLNFEHLELLDSLETRTQYGFNGFWYDTKREALAGKLRSRGFSTVELDANADLIKEYLTSRP